MAKGKLFEYAVIYHPKEKKDAAGNPLETKKSILVTDITRVLAASDKEVGMLAAKSIPKDYEDKLDDVEIVIRPLAPPVAGKQEAQERAKKTPLPESLRSPFRKDYEESLYKTSQMVVNPFYQTRVVDRSVSVGNAAGVPYTTTAGSQPSKSYSAAAIVRS